jgi:hypothetical protein
VQVIVDALRDPEELGIALDNRPTRVDAGAAGIGQQGLQHLGNPAAACGRVDVPDDPIVEQLQRPDDRVDEQLVTVGGEHILEPFGLEGIDLDLGNGHGYILPDAGVPPERMRGWPGFSEPTVCEVWRTRI